jgi:hypothetical protein
MKLRLVRVDSLCNFLQLCERLRNIFSLLITVNLRCVGGEVGATSSLAPKIGPLGLVSINTNIIVAAVTIFLI